MSTAKSIEELLKDPSILKKGSAGAPAAQSATAARTITAAKDDDVDTAPEALQRKMEQIKFHEIEAKAQIKAKQMNVPYIDLVEFPISPDTLTMLPKPQCEANKVVCFLYLSDQIRLGALEPTSPAVKELAYQIGEEYHAQVEIYLITQRSFDYAYEVYKRMPIYKKPAAGVSIKPEELEQYKDIGLDFKKLQEQIKKTSITDLVTLIIAASIQARSSDVHVEAEEKDIKLRFRIDGVLHDAASIDYNLWPQVIARIKLLAKLKLNITAKPQDGRFTIQMEKDKIDVRVSTIPTAYGESVVMRLLRSSVTSLQFDDLGMIGLAAQRLKEQIQRPNGMVITTGPTGSGKTTTLYAILNKLNVEGTKIITLEDPIEYRLNGINQSQIDKSKDYSFASGLRSILRQDPDIVMVGELRDLETADTAINAALTGHFVLSTLHTNSAAGAVPRFLAMGVKGFLLAPALNAVMAQRLVRTLCDKCKQEYQPDEKELARAKAIIDTIPNNHPDKPDFSKLKFQRGQGCAACDNMGYRGRVGIFEIMIMTPDIEKQILSEKASEYEMQDLAIKNQMLTMAQDGVLKAGLGITTLEEVFRVSE